MNAKSVLGITDLATSGYLAPRCNDKLVTTYNNFYPYFAHMTKQRDASIDGDALKTETTISLIFFPKNILFAHLLKHVKGVELYKKRINKPKKPQDIPTRDTLK